MWVPLTVNCPAVGPVIVPGVVAVLSPQSIVAEYSAAVATGSGSVKVATMPVKVTPSVAPNVVPLAVIGGSAMGGANPGQIRTRLLSPVVSRLLYRVPLCVRYMQPSDPTCDRSPRKPPLAKTD